MGIALLDTEYWELWEESNQSSQRSYHSDSSDIIEECPKHLGKGYRRWIQLRDGLDLLIHNYELQDDLTVKLQPDEAWLEFGFQISGNRSHRDGRSRSAGQNFLQWGSRTVETCKVGAGQQILQVDIHLESASQFSSFIAGEFELLPWEPRQLIKGSAQQPYDHIGTTTPAMQLALEQILNCPYQGLTKQIYLESKCLELIALRLEQLVEGEKEFSKSKVLQPDDIDRILHAKEILICHLDNPPSLLVLARQVGLNDYKLKLGFRQVFGTTVFGYLHAHRMEQARQLLVEKQMKVQEVAKVVGYASPSRFTAAFKRKFGVNPSAYLAS